MEKVRGIASASKVNPQVSLFISADAGVILLPPALENTHFLFILVTFCFFLQLCHRTDYHKDNEPLVALGKVSSPRSEVCEDVEYVKHTLFKAAENADIPSCLVGNFIITL